MSTGTYIWRHSNFALACTGFPSGVTLAVGYCMVSLRPQRMGTVYLCCSMSLDNTTVLVAASINQNPYCPTVHPNKSEPDNFVTILCKPGTSITLLVWLVSVRAIHQVAILLTVVALLVLPGKNSNPDCNHSGAHK